VNYRDANGGISSPYGSEQNPFDHSFAGQPAMTSSQQDIRPAPPHSGPVQYSGGGGPIGGGVRMPYPSTADERLSERGSSVANPLDERFSDPESSVMGYPADPRYSNAPWRPAEPLYEHGLTWISWWINDEWIKS